MVDNIGGFKLSVPCALSPIFLSNHLFDFAPRLGEIRVDFVALLLVTYYCCVVTGYLLLVTCYRLFLTHPDLFFKGRKKDGDGEGVENVFSAPKLR